ncbi:MAG: hypothetical protein JW741_11680 [Sedimentisphaerales bacterium]|nr:hypothetical protein [Sedimentisphaerales bacterium]
MHKRTLTMILTAGLCLAAGNLRAGTLAKTEIGADANWIVHVDHEAFLRSTVGKLVRAELSVQGMEEKIQSFATVFGFHPLDDVRDVTLYGAGGDRKKAVVLIDGTFDQDKLLALVRTNAEHAEFDHKGVTIHRWLHEEKKAEESTTQMMYGCLYDGHLVVMSGDLDTTKRAIASVRRPTATAPADLMRATASDGDDVLFQVVGKDIGAMVGDKPQAALLRQTEALRLHIGETAGKVFIRITLKAKSQEMAQSMGKMLEGMLAMATLAGQDQPALAEAARTIQLSTEGKTTRVRFEAQAQSIFDLLKKHWEQKKQQSEATS